MNRKFEEYGMRQWVLLTLLCVLSSPAAHGQDTVTDYDKRAAATLYSCLAGKDVQWQAITAQQLKPGLTRYEKNAETKRATYAMNFGGDQNGVDTRGFYRITLGEDLTDAASGGWTSFKKDPKSGVEILFKKIEKSDAEKYLNIAARKKVGKVILTIAQRRPLGESVDAAAADVGKRFDTFLAQANRNQLFGGRIRMILISRDDQPELPSGEPFLFTMNENEPTVFVIRIEAIGPDDQPAKDLRHISLELSGSVAGLAKASVNEKSADISKRYLVKEPPSTIEVTLTIPAGTDPAIREILYNNLNGAASDTQQSWMLKVGVSQK
jgi:hypothetical protein